MSRSPLRPRAGACAGGLLLVLLAVTLPAPARATVVLSLDLAGLTAQADLVVRGRVVATASRWDDEGRRIYTDATLVVDDVYKGRARAGQALVVTRLGGAVGGIGMRVPGEAVLRPGEEAVLFLRRHVRPRATRLTVVGMAQGKLAVLRDQRGAHVLPVVGGAGLRLVAPARDGHLRRVAARPALRPLRDLEREIRRLAASPRTRAVRP